MPRLTLPNNTLSTKFATPRLAACTSFSAHEFSTTVSSLLVFHKSTKHPGFTRLHIYVEKVFFCDFATRFFFLLARNADWDASVLFPRKDLFEAGTSHAEDKKWTTQLCCRWLSNSRSHSPCTQTNLLDGNQLLFPVTKLILLSSTIAQVKALQRFLEIKI